MRPFIDNNDRVPPVSLLRPGKSSRPLLGPGVILLAAAVACVPLMIHGPSCGHDFDFHLISWFDALASWRHGLLYPHWTPSANYWAGEPRFVFYPPLTWMLGAALGAVLPWSLVPLAMTYLVLTGTGLATRALARQALEEAPATLAGCAAIFSGYTLFTAYERTAFAEFAGGVWIPLVLLFLLRIRKSSVSEAAHSASILPVWKRAFDGSTAPLALAVAGAWLSNPTVGVMACYTLAALALVVAWIEKSWAVVLRGAVGAALGMGVIAAYLLPAAWERRWVDILQVTEDPGQTLENNWLFAVHADPALALHDAVLRTASFLVIGMTVVALGGALLCWGRGRFGGLQGRRWWLPLALIPVAVLLLQFPFSHPLWALPELRFLQFPWRWLIVLEAPMGIFFAAAVWPRASAPPWKRAVVVTACVAIFLGMTACAEHFFFQICDDEDSVWGMLRSYQVGAGFIGTNEYEPIGADNGLLAVGLPGVCLVSDPKTVLGVPPSAPQDDDAPPVWTAAQGSCEANILPMQDYFHSSVEHRIIRFYNARSTYAILRLRSYPAWKVRVNGHLVEELPKREDGLMAVPVPQGPVNLTVDWTTTPDVVLGSWISGLAALLLTALCLLERRYTRSRLS